MNCSEKIRSKLKSVSGLFRKSCKSGLKPLPCPICGNSPSLEYGDDIVCDKCSSDGKAVRAPRIWHLGHEEAGIRAWNRWVKKFLKDGRSSVCGEVCLNLFSWHEMGYDDRTMTKDDPWYSEEGDRGDNYRKECDLRRSNYGRITGPYCREDKGLVGIFGESSVRFENPGLKTRLGERIRSFFGRR